MTPRDPIREALVSARTRAWLAYVDAPTNDEKLLRAYTVAVLALTRHDERTTPAASSDAGDTTTEGNP